MVELPEQNNYQVAMDAAWTKLLERPDSELLALGAEKEEAIWHVPSLDRRFYIDPAERSVGADVHGEDLSSSRAGTFWKILVLHYLLAPTPVPPATGTMAFEDIPDGRGYTGPYRGRVVARFCGTVGRSREQVVTAADALGGRRVEGGDCAARFDVFPFVPITVIWYDGGEEFPPGASFLYQDNITSIFDVEDVVVASERLVSRLSGKPW